MYARFYRWASDRLGDEGVLAFVTNRSFIDSRTFDGFRKTIAKDFSELWLVDLGGDVRENPELSGTRHNVFGIQTGVTIAFLVRRKSAQSLVLKYTRRPEVETADAKLAWLGSANIDELKFFDLRPDSAGNWLDIGGDEFSNFMPIADRATKANNSSSGDRAIFRLFGQGLFTGRDDWAIASNHAQLTPKVQFFLIEFSRWAKTGSFGGSVIKWSRNLKRRLTSNRASNFTDSTIRQTLYRPFARMAFYDSPILVDESGQLDAIFPANGVNVTIIATYPGSQKPFMCGVSDIPFDYHYTGAAAISTGFARYRYTKSGERIDNITDWALNKFVAHYDRKGVTKDAIFHYVYAVLHDPVYRETYALNLKREFPRIPFYPDFARWAAWGEQLMAMHIGYEAVAPWPVERIDTPNPKRAEGTHPKPILRSVPDQGLVRIDEDTQITGVPVEAWDYRLGNRSAIDWVLDQHKEKRPRDPTIAAKFNTYRFADYKESMIALLAKVVRVSVDTVAITQAMRAVPRPD